MSEITNKIEDHSSKVSEVSGNKKCTVDYFQSQLNCG
jgi:hypothetical protein